MTTEPKSLLALACTRLGVPVEGVRLIARTICEKPLAYARVCIEALIEGRK